MVEASHDTPAPASIEIEVKLQGGKRKIARVAAEALAAGARSSPVISAYYDTPDRSLRKAGYSLRLRLKGDRYELTLKQDAGGAVARGEWTALVSSEIADARLLPGDAPEEAVAIAAAGPLEAVFRTEIDRLKQDVDLGGAIAEIAIDQGRIVSGDRATPVREVELELKRGDPAAMVAHARRLADAHSLAVSTLTKADRGYLLRDDAPPAWAKASRPELDAGMVVGDVMRLILSSASDQIRANLAAAADGRDPEGVHQLRVALRRLRSAIALFRDELGPAGKTWNRQAKRALSTLGAARDLDVFLTETLPPMQAEAPADSGLAALAEAAEQARAWAYADLRRMLKRRNFTRLSLDLAWAAAGGFAFADVRPAAGVARALLDERHGAAMKAGASFETLPPADRHKVRIAIKKLRYALDYLQSLFPAEHARAYPKRLKQLQEDLGALNDAAVASDIVDRLVAAAPDAATAETAAAGAALVKQRQAARLADAEAHIVEHWNAFAATRPFWRED